MAQIIKHRRGTLANLSSVTLNNGEIGVVTSSVSNIGDAALKTALVVGHTDGTNRLSVSRLSYGTAVPNLGGITGGANFNDLIHYDSDNYKLYRLNTGGNTDLDLTGAIAGRALSGSLIVTGVADFESDIEAHSNIDLSGSLFLEDATAAITHQGATGLNITSTSGYVEVEDVRFTSGQISASSFISASALHVEGNIEAEGNITIGGTLTIGDSATDSVSFSADVTSDIIPNASDSYDLGSDSQRWNDLYLSGSISASGGNHSILSTGTIDIDADGALTIDGGSITIGGDSDVAFDIDTSTLDIDSSGAITIDGTSTVSIDGGGATNLTTSAGAITIDSAASTVLVDGHTGVEVTSTNSGTVTIDGKAGVAIQEDGTDVIAIDTNRDVLFSQTGGSTSDPDVEFDGYTRFDGVTEVADGTQSTSTTTGALLVDGGAGIVKNVNIGGNLTVTGDYTVNGTTTFVSSSTLDIGDNIIQVNGVSPVRYGGIHVADSTGDVTGSMVWDSSNDIWVAGQSGSEYRVPVQAATSNLTENRPVIVDGNGRLESSARITDDGTTVNMGVSTHVTGSIFASTGASVASGSSIAFQVPASTQLGYMSSADSEAVTAGLVGYNASNGNLTVSSVIDGGSF